MAIESDIHSIALFPTCESVGGSEKVVTSIAVGNGNEEESSE
ncbi:hypothetical protein VOA_001733 [Vibrio sp. RC586]|nr:hypothetical protein VOA_001733 [Vibrio sp. RC586]